MLDYFFVKHLAQIIQVFTKNHSADNKSYLSISRKELLQQQLSLLTIPITITVLYFLFKLTPLINPNIGIVIGIWAGTILKVVFQEKNHNYIYNYSLDNTNIKLYLTNIFGNTKTLTTPLQQVEKLKDHKPIIWVHSNESAKKYSFLKKDLGNKLVSELP